MGKQRSRKGTGSPLTAPPAERKEALDSLLPFQREDFAGLFRVMDGLPVIIRLIDPPPHEFLPDPITLMQALFDLKLQLQHASKMNELNGLLEEIQKKEQLLKQATGMREANPMLGLRGVRLGMTQKPVFLSTISNVAFCLKTLLRPLMRMVWEN